ncbi:MAG: hypothetical protein MI863_25215 [Desulfobacterales bacterium]|nr:hypothetical protein [Desulfobacterales bacterium]
MKTLIYCSLFLATLFSAIPARALDAGDFTRAEYVFTTNESAALDLAPRSLAGKRAGYYDFINFEPDREEKLVTYLETPDRQFSKRSLIIRVREDLKNPWKSKITVKLRAPSPGQFGDLKRYKKAEIDIAHDGTKKYSVSYDIKFDPAGIDVRKVDVAAVAARIKKKSPEAWALAGPVFTEQTGKIRQTIVMRALSWEGRLTKAPDRVEVDYAIWSPYYKYPGQFISELSYKISTSNKDRERPARQIHEALMQKGILSDSPASKTKATFKMSPDFN